MNSGNRQGIVSCGGGWLRVRWPAMMGLRAVLPMLAVLVGALPLVPAEHVHESDVDGHHEVLAHRHAESHVPGRSSHHHDDNAAADNAAAEGAADSTSDHGAFDHSPERAITLGVAFMAPVAYVGVVPFTPLIALLPAPPTAVPLGPVANVERLIHGPPRTPVGFRGPPSFARL
jgi:hypothetical protein